MSPTVAIRGTYRPAHHDDQGQPPHAISAITRDRLYAEELLLVRDDTASVATGTPGAPSQVLVATGVLPVGTTGEDLVAEGLVESREFAPGQVAPGAVTSTALLANQTVTVEISEGGPWSTALMPS